MERFHCNNYTSQPYILYEVLAEGNECYALPPSRPVFILG